jgi:hypothetical protein
MSDKRFKAKMPDSLRLQMHLRAALSHAVCNHAQMDNEVLTFDGCEDVAEPNLRDRSAAAEPLRRARLNGFFAISVNSPAMSMVNFSCCVCSAPTSCVSGVTRRLAPQPMLAAVRMEVGAHACL